MCFVVLSPYSLTGTGCSTLERAGSGRSLPSPLLSSGEESGEREPRRSRRGSLLSFPAAPKEWAPAAFDHIRRLHSAAAVVSWAGKRRSTRSAAASARFPSPLPFPSPSCPHRSGLLLFSVPLLFLSSPWRARSLLPIRGKTCCSLSMQISDDVGPSVSIPHEERPVIKRSRACSLVILSLRRSAPTHPSTEETSPY